jgi:hypothetical protein
MRYWWVNQNQTVTGCAAATYGHPSAMPMVRATPIYKSRARSCSRGFDVSLLDTRIVAIGIAQPFCWESPKPQESGNARQNWEDIGWKVRIAFTELLHKVRPTDHIDLLRSPLPKKYSPTNRAD